MPIKVGCLFQKPAELGPRNRKKQNWGSSAEYPAAGAIRTDRNWPDGKKVSALLTKFGKCAMIKTERETGDGFTLNK